MNAEQAIQLIMDFNDLTKRLEEAENAGEGILLSLKEINVLGDVFDVYNEMLAKR